MKHRISLKAAVSSLAAAIAPVILVVALVPASALAAPLHTATVPTSTDFAGWLAPVTSTVSKPSARTTFKVPKVICTATNDFVALGVGLPSASSVIASGVDVGCYRGVPFYAAETELNGTITTLPVTVSPGDTIVTSLTVLPGGTTGSFQDVTKHFTKSLSGAGGRPADACIVFNGAPGGAPVPNFGKVVFSSSMLNGVTITAAKATRVNMATAGGVLQISTGAVNATGTGFTSTFVNAGFVSPRS